MLRQLIFGGAVSLGNIAIHAAAMMVIIRSRGRDRVRCADPVRASAGRNDDCNRFDADGCASCRGSRSGRSPIRSWELPASTDDLYFAFVNYTTLGYGDISPVARWRLLGPLTAMNGVLLFGWSTAVI